MPEPLRRREDGPAAAGVEVNAGVALIGVLGVVLEAFPEGGL